MTNGRLHVEPRCRDRLAYERESGQGWRLSKSKLTSFQHCARRLWLQVHRREAAVIDSWTQRLFETGHRVGELARCQVPNGILIDPDPRNLVAALAETKQALQQRRPLFEPAFVRDGVVVRVDILEPQSDGAWKLIEVKNSAAVRPYQVEDVACQGWVLAGNGVQLAGLSVRLPAQVLRAGQRWQNRNFIDVDITQAAKGRMDAVPLLAEAARNTLEGAEPDRPMGPHCSRPLRCEFREHCSRGAKLAFK